MNTSFAAATLTLSGIAARLLGWRPDEFWKATPAELAASLGLYKSGSDAGGLDRQTLEKMMEREDDR